MKGLQIGRCPEGHEHLSAEPGGLYDRALRGRPRPGGSNRFAWIVFAAIGMAPVGWLDGCAPATSSQIRLGDHRDLPAGALAKAALPPHAVDLGYGTWSCEDGYLMRGRECVPEAEAARAAGPRFEVSTLPSAGEGSPQPSSEPVAAVPEAPASQPAAPSSPQVFIQTNQPWTVFLDSQGNPSTVIVGPGR